MRKINPRKRGSKAALARQVDEVGEGDVSGMDGTVGQGDVSGQLSILEKRVKENKEEMKTLSKENNDLRLMVGELVQMADLLVSQNEQAAKFVKLVQIKEYQRGYLKQSMSVVLD